MFDKCCFMIGNCWWLTVHGHDDDDDDNDDNDDEDEEYNGKRNICWVAVNLLDNLRHATYCWHFCCNIHHVSDRFISSPNKLFPFSLPGSRVWTLRKMMIFGLVIPSEVCLPDYTPLARMFQKPSSLPTMHNTAMYLVNVRRSTCQHRVISTCCWDHSWLPFGNGNMM